jgi:drug/metabolite transporter (DMT)-like permease
MVAHPPQPQGNPRDWYMSVLVFCAVLAAALLHASWNAMIKGASDKQLNMIAVVLGHVPFAVLAIAIFPAPDPASIPYIAAGMSLHFGYQFFLIRAYDAGDLTQIYPLARGSAPMLVAIISVAFLGVTLAPLEMAAIGTIGLGILSMALLRKQGGARNPQGAKLALITGCFIAAYSLVDGTGARVAESPIAFYGWLAMGNAVLMAIFVAATAPHQFRALATRGKRVFVIGGSASYAAYGLVIWAFTQSPIALVTALRETSIIFALVIGVVFLKEKPDRTKIIATAITLIGVALLRVAK